jgi:hypothetical protein
VVVSLAILKKGLIDIHAIDSTVSRLVRLPLRSTNVIVSVVPVSGLHVILNGDPAVIELPVVRVNGFCAPTKCTEKNVTTTGHGQA